MKLVHERRHRVLPYKKFPLVVLNERLTLSYRRAIVSVVVILWTLWAELRLVAALQGTSAYLLVNLDLAMTLESFEHALVF